jgi:hypothetical protein
MFSIVIFAILFFVGLDFLFFGKVFITYQLKASELRVMLFRIIPVMVIPLELINKIERITQLRWMMSGIADIFCSRVFAARLLLRKSTGFFKEIVITPDNPDQFIAEVKRRVKEKTSREKTGTVTIDF